MSEASLPELECADCGFKGPEYAIEWAEYLDYKNHPFYRCEDCEKLRELEDA